MSASPVRLPLASVFIGNIGNVLEWYDFVVFAFLAPVIGARFFPAEDPLSALIHAFAVFAVGYLMRPIGGVLFGHLGDRLGRKRALQLSMVVMAVPTALMAVLPTHAEAGALAPVLLVLLRLCQGLSVGGEVAGSICYLVEAAPPHRRAFVGSLTILGIAAGVLLASAVVGLLSLALAPAEIHAWGWRLPFLGGLVIGTVGWWVRRGLEETAAFRQLAEAGRLARVPVIAVVRDYWPRLLQVFGANILVAVGFYTLFTWMPTYLAHIVQPPVARADLINTAATFLIGLVIPLAGWTADRVGYRRVLLGADLLYAALVVPAFQAIDRGVAGSAAAAILSLSVVHAFSNGPIPALLTDLLPTHLRYTGIALGYNLAFALFGGTAPLVATWLVKTTHDLTAPAWYIVAAALVSFLVTFSATQPAARAPSAERVRS